MLDQMASTYTGPAGEVTKHDAPKVDKFERGYIYILGLSNGFTKIGSSAEPVSRMKSLKRGLRSTAVKLENLWLSVAHINYKDNEKAVIQYLENKERDGEFFKVNFSEALDFVSGLKIKMDFTLDELEAKESRKTAFIDSLNHLHELSRQQKN